MAGDEGKRTIEAAARTGKAVMETLEHVGDKSRDALRSAASPTSRGYEELASQGTDGLDAMAASGRASFDIMQELHREWLSFAQAQFSESIEAGREFARCRSPKDLLEVADALHPFVGGPVLDRGNQARRAVRAGGERQSKAAAGARGVCSTSPVLIVPKGRRPTAPPRRPIGATAAGASRYTTTTASLPTGSRVWGRDVPPLLLPGTQSPRIRLFASVTFCMHPSSSPPSVIWRASAMATADWQPGVEPTWLRGV